MSGARVRGLSSGDERTEHASITEALRDDPPKWRRRLVSRAKSATRRCCCRRSSNGRLPGLAVLRRGSLRRSGNERAGRRDVLFVALTGRGELSLKHRLSRQRPQQPDHRERREHSEDGTRARERDEPDQQALVRRSSSGRRGSRWDRWRPTSSSRSASPPGSHVGVPPGASRAADSTWRRRRARGHG